MTEKLREYLESTRLLREAIKSQANYRYKSTWKVENILKNRIEEKLSKANSYYNNLPRIAIATPSVRERVIYNAQHSPIDMLRSPSSIEVTPEKCKNEVSPYSNKLSFPVLNRRGKLSVCIKFNHLYSSKKSLLIKKIYNSP